MFYRCVLYNFMLYSFSEYRKNDSDNEMFKYKSIFINLNEYHLKMFYLDKNKSREEDIDLSLRSFNKQNI